MIEPHPFMTGYSGKRILLIVTGGIAAYKSAILVRLLHKAGSDVRVVMTDAAQRFITAVTLQALSGNPVHVDMWDPRVADNMGHIELSRDRDLIVVAPASADFLAKIAHGLADDLASTICLARECPLYVVPTSRCVTGRFFGGFEFCSPPNTDSGSQACMNAVA